MAKVLIVAPYLPHPVRHGGAVRSRLLLDALAADHEVHLAAATTSRRDWVDADALAAETGVTVHALPAVSAPHPTLHKKLARWLLGSSELVARRWAPQAASRAAAISDAVRPDLCVVDSTFALPVSIGSRQVLHLHNLESAMFARADGQSRGMTDRLTRHFEARGLRNWERSAVNKALLTITVSDHDRALVREMCPGARVETVANSVDLERLPLVDECAAKAPVRLLFLGSLDYPPNLEAVSELVMAHLPVLRAAFPGLTVRIVGKDPQDFGARFAGVPGVERIGAVDEVLPSYRDVHAVYLPIRSGGGTRIKILEAWAAGVPVLTTQVGCEGLPAVDGENLRCFATPEQGASVLGEVLRGQGRSLREQGRRLVEAAFSHAAARARLRALFAEITRA